MYQQIVRKNFLCREKSTHDPHAVKEGIQTPTGDVLLAMMYGGFLIIWTTLPMDMKYILHLTFQKNLILSRIILRSGNIRDQLKIKLAKDLCKNTLTGMRISDCSHRSAYVFRHKFIT